MTLASEFSGTFGSHTVRTIRKLWRFASYIIQIPKFNNFPVSKICPGVLYNHITGIFTTDDKVGLMVTLYINAAVLI